MNQTPSPSRPPSLKLSPPVLLVVTISIAIFLMRQEQQNPEKLAKDPASTETESAPESTASTSETQPGKKTPSTVPDAESKEKPPGFLTEVAPNRFSSPAGLIYRSGSVDGHRIDHIMQHAKDNPKKPIHGVFNGNRDEIFALIDQAWKKSIERGPPDVQKKTERGRTVITVNMKKNIGYVGGESGQRKGHPPCTKIRLVLEENNVITAYPMQ